MQSHLILQLETTIAETIHSNHVPYFSNWNIPYALIHLYKVRQGQISQQSSNNFLIHTDLFEYLLTEQLTIDFIKEEATIILIMMLEGTALLEDENRQPINEITASSYHLAYVANGQYGIKLNPGTSKLLVFTLRPEWFISKTDNIDEFKTLNQHYIHKKSGIYALPSCSINKNLTNNLRNVFAKFSLDEEKQFIAISTFFLRLIKSYRENLVYHNFTTTSIHKAKATIISDFIEQNFTDRVVDDIPGIAKDFGISIKGLHRLSINAFGKSMKKQVIMLRMSYALDLVTNTNKPIHEIALLSGYNDSNYFSHAFKKYFKQSPSEVRLLS